MVKYSFCSYRSWFNKKGREWINFCFSASNGGSAVRGGEDYPILDFTMDGDSFDFNNYC